MRTELYELLYYKVERFMKQFEKIPLKRFNTGTALQKFYFNYFCAMTNSFKDALWHIDYANIKSLNYLNETQIFSNICLTFNEEDFLTHAINLNLQENTHHQDVVFFISERLEIIRKAKTKKTQQRVIYSYEVDNNTRYLISGMVFNNSITNEITLHLFSIFLPLSNIDTKVNMSGEIASDLSKFICKEIYSTFSVLKSLNPSILNELTQKHNVSLEQLNDYANFYYGTNIIEHAHKEQFLKSLELLLFSKKDIEKVASKSGYKTWKELNNLYQEIPTFHQGSIIRFNSSFNK